MTSVMAVRMASDASTLMTYDRELVIAAARTLMERIAGH